jgi:iron complex transport system ATP-binding protein
LIRRRPEVIVIALPKERESVPSESPLLQIENATIYRGARRVFDRLDLVIEAGRNTAILGPNGSGKTTLLKLIHRELYPAHGGTVRLFGRERWVVSELRSRIGIVSHELQVQYQRNASGGDVVLSGLYSSIGVHRHQTFGQQQVAAARRAAERLRCAHLWARRFDALSAGEQRRLLLARALVHDPPALILDEPTNSLDLRATFELLANLRELAAAGKTMLLVTHDVAEILPEIEHVVLLADGAVAAAGAKREMLTSERLSALYDTPLEVVERQGFFRVVPASTH